MPKARGVADLLQKHETTPSIGCGTCREPHGPLLKQLLEHAIGTQQRITVGQLAACLRDETGYGLSKAALSKHLADCVPDLYLKINLSRRGARG